MSNGKCYDLVHGTDSGQPFVLRWDWESLKGALGRFALEVAESAVLSCFEPKPISSCYDDELPRARQAILRARDGKLARFRYQVNRNAFLIACRDYAGGKPEEHLIIGYGFRYGSTTKVESLHHIIGQSDSVHLPDNVAHAMWDFYGQNESNELLVFHNHPYNPLNFVFDNWPLTSRQDRLFVKRAALIHRNWRVAFWAKVGSSSTSEKTVM